jgi:hypothetical protein
MREGVGLYSAELRPSPGRGLGVFATADVEAGHVVLVEKPLCVGLSPMFVSYCCSGCFNVDLRSPEPLALVCGLCGSRWCSAACRDSDPSHARLCGPLKRMREARQRLAGLKLSVDEVTFLASMISALSEGRGLLDGLAAGKAVNEEQAWQLAREFSQCEIDSAAFDRLASTEQNNAVSIVNLTPMGGLAVGRAVFDVGSRFNHSCRPNVVRLRRGRKMHYIASRRVAKGDELCISYVPPRMAEKREALLKDYGFACACGQCDRDDEVEVCDECGAEMLLGQCVMHNANELVKIVNY